jgi:hypothetical protein
LTPTKPFPSFGKGGGDEEQDIWWAKRRETGMPVSCSRRPMQVQKPAFSASSRFDKKQARKNGKFRLKVLPSALYFIKRILIPGAIIIL